jgi:hypothetical protein
MQQAFFEDSAMTPHEQLHRIERKLVKLRQYYQSPSNRRIHNHGFQPGEPVSVEQIQDLERRYRFEFPLEFRELILRFGDQAPGPGPEDSTITSIHQSLNDGVGHSFPFESPFWGMMSEAYLNGTQEERDRQEEELWRQWNEEMPLEFGNGSIEIADYGCRNYARLIINGKYQGQVWVHGGTPGFGPFGHNEELHSGSSPETVFIFPPKDYTFLEWYEHWVDSEIFNHFGANEEGV